MTAWYSWLSSACLVTGAVCAACAVYLDEASASPWGAIWHASIFICLGMAIRAYKPPR